MRRQTRKILPGWLFRAVLVTAAMSPAGCRPDTAAYKPLAAGDPAPAFGAPTLEGDSVTLASLRDGPVMMNVWATWCAPCRDEMPHLQQLHERYADRGLRVVGVSVDTRGSEATMRRFLDEVGVTFMILHDAADVVSRQFRTNGVPETFLIGRDGTIRRRWIGRFDPLAADVVADVEAALD